MKNKQRTIELTAISEETAKDASWRICLSEDHGDLSDPLISPWKCSGTMKYIHLKWLTEWLESKKSSKDGVHFRSYLWETIFWELCKEEFQSAIYSKGKRINLLGYDVPKNGHYLVLEAINTEEIMRKKTKIIHIVDFKNLNTIILGRGNDAHVKISDISISRNHANLRIIDNKEIWLEDHQSKFGSLIIQNDPVELSLKSGKTTLQLSRTLLTVQCKFPSSCWWFKPASMIKGFSLINYIEDFPLSIRELAMPKRLLLLKEKESLEDNHEFFDCAEKKTTTNILESHRIANSSRNKGGRTRNLDVSLNKDGVRITSRRLEESKTIDLLNSRHINDTTPSKKFCSFWIKFMFYAIKRIKE